MGMRFGRCCRTFWRDESPRVRWRVGIKVKYRKIRLQEFFRVVLQRGHPIRPMCFHANAAGDHLAVPGESMGPSQEMVRPALPASILTISRPARCIGPRRHTGGRGPLSIKKTSDSSKEECSYFVQLCFLIVRPCRFLCTSYSIRADTRGGLLQEIFLRVRSHASGLP